MPLSAEDWFWISILVGGSCAITSVIVVIIAVRDYLRGGGEDEEASEAPPFDAMPGDGEARLQGPLASSGGAEVVAPPER